MRRSYQRALKEWMLAFVPAPMLASRREKILGSVAAFLGLLLSEWICRFLLKGQALSYIAPMGASAVLLFAVPSSPLAQPWSIMGGNLVAALIGVTIGMLISDPGLAAALAASLAIACMMKLRCLHPPSGAVALTAVLGGPHVRELGFAFVFVPVLLNSFFLLACALIFNGLLKRNYPHRVPAPADHATKDLPPTQRLGFSQKDLEEALAAREEFLDVSAEDLREILASAEAMAYARRVSAIRCRDIMSRDVVTIQPGQFIIDVWDLMTKHHVRALPVVDHEGFLVGIVSFTDIVERERDERNAQPYIVPAYGLVMDVMTEDVTSVRADDGIASLVPFFADRGFHHLPVLDAAGKVEGIVTQADMIAGLYQKNRQEI